MEVTFDGWQDARSTLRRRGMTSPDSSEKNFRFGHILCRLGLPWMALSSDSEPSKLRALLSG
jgi:hypothetical protein